LPPRALVWPGIKKAAIISTLTTKTVPSKILDLDMQSSLSCTGSASKLAERPRKYNWLGLAAIFIVAAILGFGIVDAWDAAPSYDEGTYYIPAIRGYSQLLPRISLDPPFPGPPTGLLVQALIYRAFHNSWLALRQLSALSIIGIVILLYFNLKRFGTSSREALVMLLLAGHPFVLYHAFVFKQHALMLMFLLAGMLLWESATKTGSNARLFGACLMLTLAVTTNQLTAPICIGMAIEAWRTRSENPKWLLRLTAAGVPIAILAGFFVLWRGTIPPAYRSQPIVSGVRFGTLHGAQLLALFLTLGFWLAPSVGLSPRGVMRSLIFALPFVLGFILWHGYDSSTNFYATIVGPISTVLRAVSAKSHVAGALIGGLICGLGANLLWTARREGANTANLGVLVATYAATMLVVPYQFECYYVVLVLAAWFVLRRRILYSRPRPLAVAHQILVVVVGLFYAVYKVTGIISS